MVLSFLLALLLAHTYIEMSRQLKVDPPTPLVDGTMLCTYVSNVGIQEKSVES